MSRTGKSPLLDFQKSDLRNEKIKIFVLNISSFARLKDSSSKYLLNLKVLKGLKINVKMKAPSLT